jgi:hypothetical protein
MIFNFSDTIAPERFVVDITLRGTANVVVAACVGGLLEDIHDVVVNVARIKSNDIITKS